jgi:hypothetical protein
LSEETTTTLLLDPVLEVKDEGPNFLIDWPSPWEDFRSNISPAMTKSQARLAGEAHGGLFPYKGMSAAVALDILLIFLSIYVPIKLDQMHPHINDARPKLEVIYYSGPELPQTEDLGGAETGKTGASGGDEARHPTQTIRVARGTSATDRVVDAPSLKLPHSNTEVANLLALAANPGPPPTEGLKSTRSLQLPQDVVAPAPDVQRDRMQSAPSLTAGVVAPTQNSPQRDLRAAPSLTAGVVAPAQVSPQRQLQTTPSMESRVVAPTPGIAQRDITMQVPGSHPVQVVPPPVSAPEQFSNQQARLTLPASAVVAPAPQISREVSTGPGYGPGQLQRQVVPPPVQMAGGSPRAGNGQGLGGGVDVVPPPVQLSGGATQRAGMGGGLGGGTSVVPPPVDAGGGRMGQQVSGGLGGGIAVVPPAPSVAGGVAGGTGSGSRGNGRGTFGDLGDVAAPPAGGNGDGKGVVVSKQPGTEKGIPGGGPGALAMSPTGGTKAGVGGSGGGEGLGRGDGPGGGFTGAGPGAGKTGAGKGAELNAKSGISPYPGPGGSGTATSGTPAVPGVSVRGGNNIVKLPSFSDGGASEPTTPGRTTKGKGNDGPGITVVASARSGGAFNFYGVLKGDKVYTIYIDTNLGPAVLQFADPSSAAHPYAVDLKSPQPIRAELPGGLAHTRLVIACVLDKSGELTGMQVLEPGDAAMTSKVLASLPRWKFQPATRDGRPVEVSAILGFNINTDDRY